MGLDINSIHLLLAARRRGATFGQTLMLGRQGLNIFPQKMAELFEADGLPSAKFRAGGPECAYAEPVFEALGAEQVDTLDNSDFEGARFIHDLNLPVPEELKNRFDAVYDGGTLEHVFNFPQALKNCMEMTREGGRFYIHTCLNNLSGHGFYQFSPELFFRALSPENGFEVERMVVHRVGPYGGWYEVTDPNAIQARVELITFTPVQLLVQAKRTASKPVFEQAPQQSDYSVMWQGKLPTPEVKNPLFPRLARLKNAFKYGWMFYTSQSLFNRKNFKKTRRDAR
jgi:SAM-dependent methyltransferase